MKIVILAGGKGTRLAEETSVKPKPMVMIGRQPIIGHIIEIYTKYGFNDFYIAAGYKYEIIEKYFRKKVNKNINVSVINTGKETQTGGRLYKLKKFLKKEQFMLTYGDGLANINIKELIKFHNKNKKMVTMTVVRPPARWGYVKILGNKIESFEEKNVKNEGWINGGFMVFEPKIFNSFSYTNKTNLENDILSNVAKKKQLSAFKHGKFWQCMDTLRDKITLNNLNKKNPPWKNKK
jgi:glucose-1-phosphate cytidylyltransferase